jgi:hypothetical protein
MKAEAQRIAIAEACGWTEVREWQNTVIGVTTTERDKHFSCHVFKECHYVSDYLTDLNAMHEAEKVLLKDTKADIVHEYGKWLQAAVGEWVSSYCPEDREVAIIAHATAAQRAEAFLRTIGKWREET